MRDPAAYFSQQAEAADAAQKTELSQMWQQVQDYHQRRHWHQLTVLMLELVARPELQTEDQLHELYTNAIADFETKINPLSLVQICTPIINQFKNKDDAAQFVDKLQEKVKANPEALVMTKVLQGKIQLECYQNIEKTKDLVEEIEGLLNDVDSVGYVHGQYYMLASAFYMREGAHADYYRASLRYLGCTDLETLQKEDRIEQAFHLSLAALLGKDIFNFGELLAHSILDDLKGTPREWIVKLLLAFNAGDVRKFGAMKSEWQGQQDLVANEITLYEKICLLALMEMTFQRSATDRSLTFTDIAKQTGLQEDKVELLVMKALAKGLVKGSIDQVAEVANLTWVQPRVLDKEQLKTLIKKVTEFTTSINFMENMIEKNASDILTM